MKFHNVTYLLAFALFSMLLSAAFVSATISFATPAAGTNHSSAIAVKVYFVNSTDGITDPIAANTTVYYNTTATAWTAVTCSSFAQNGSQATCTIAITAIPDAENVRLNVTLGNNTAVLGGIVSGVITVDDTVPVITITNKAVPLDSSVEYQLTDNIGFGSCTLTEPQGSPTTSKALVTTTKTTDSTVTWPGIYTISCTDYTGNSASDTFTVSGGSIVQIPDSSSNNNTIGIIIIIAILAYWYFKK